MRFDFNLYLVLTIIAAYLIGSIPTSVWVGRLFFGVDVRRHGSGNAGATNTLRTLGAGAAIPVLLIDVFKGFAAVQLSFLFRDNFTTFYQFVNFQLFLSVAVLLGHVFPIFAGFKGGKGIATLVGIAIAIFPWAILVSMGVFVIVVLLWQYISLGSIITAILFPIIVIFIFRTQTQSLIVFSILIALFVPFTHKANIRRLFKGEETKFSFKKKKKEHQDQ